MNGQSGGFIISLDFELMWGVRASTTIERYGGHILGVKTAIPRLLDLFQRHALHCTWATVGFLFFENKDALLASLPEALPRYADPRLSPYPALKTIGRDERDDPYHFGLSLLREIKGRPGQEIGTHTFSHFFCLQAEPDQEAFRQDLLAARRAAEAEGITLKSIVFPRNQVRADYLPICREMGLSVYRGTEAHWLYHPAGNEGEGPVKRGLRLTDSYLNLSGRHPAPLTVEHGMANLPSSRFLRPYSRRLAAVDGLKKQRILSAMRYAAARGRFFHLWFHPHNFGADQDENIALMDAIAEEAARLRERHGWPSLTMAEAAEGAAVPAISSHSAVGGASLEATAS
jgi:peptidoglycan/xylan/chitin deacetylase (PgdA/CDA1 family)